MKFKQYLNEYRKAPMVDELSIHSLQTFMSNTKHLTLLKASSTVLGKIFVIFEYSFDKNNKVFILVDRKDNQHIAGYLFIKKVSNYWQPLGSVIYNPYKNKGLGTDLYINVVNAGYQLINGTELSNSSERVWLKLKDLIPINVINIKTGAIEHWSDKPMNDNRPSSDQEWFWLTESKSINEQFYNDAVRNVQFEQWLLGKDIIHGFSCSRYCIDGLF